MGIPPAREQPNLASSSAPSNVTITTVCPIIQRLSDLSISCS